MRIGLRERSSDDVDVSYGARNVGGLCMGPYLDSTIETARGSGFVNSFLIGANRGSLGERKDVESGRLAR